MTDDRDDDDRDDDDRDDLPPASGETEHERNNRRLGELLEETRLAMPGVQLLFGFLLAVPFQSRFEDITRLQRMAYITALLCAAAATAAFVTPTAVHRLRFRQRDKAFIIRLANDLIIVGLALLAVAMTSAILLVTTFILTPPAPAIITATTAVMFTGLWFGLGLARRADRGHVD